MASVIDLSQVSPSGLLEFASEETLQNIKIPEVNHIGIYAGKSTKDFPDNGQNYFGPISGVTWKDVTIDSGKKWGSRSYNMRSARVLNTTINNINLIPTSEHAIYWNLIGDCDPTDVIYFDGLTASGIGGQVFQFASRATEALAENMQGQWPTIFLKNCVGINTATLPDHRGSYAYSAFFHENGYISGSSGPRTIGNDISGVYAMQNCYLDNRMQERSKGNVVVEGRYITYIDRCAFAASSYDKQGSEGGQTAVVLRGPYTANDVEALQNFNIGNSNRLTFSLDDWIAPPYRTLIIRNSWFVEENPGSFGRVVIRGFDNIYIQGNKGNLDILIQDEQAGVQSLDFDLIKGGETITEASRVQYDVYNGSITDNLHFVRDASGVLQQVS